MSKARGLGKGLSSLMGLDAIQPDSVESTDTEGIYREIPIKKIVVNPFQPRTDFQEETIKELAQSIETQGLLQPIVVRPSGDYYQIISGERRFRALGSLKWEKAPVLIREGVNDTKMLELALVENIQRENLNEVEKALSYERLLTDCGLSHSELSEKIGNSRSAITNTLRLLKLPEEVQSLLRTGSLSAGHARALLGLEEETHICEAAKSVITKGLSVRETERMVQKSKETPTPSAEREQKPTQFNGFVENWRSFSGVKVAIKAKKKGGVIEIPFSSEEELKSITERFSKREAVQ